MGLKTFPLHPTGNLNTDFIKQTKRKSHEQEGEYIHRWRNDGSNEEYDKDGMTAIMPHRFTAHQLHFGKKEDYDGNLKHQSQSKRQHRER